MARSHVPSPPTPLPKGEGSGLPECLADSIEDTVGLMEYLVVPEPQHDQARSAQPVVPDALCTSRREMRRTVSLDDDARLLAEEVHDVRAQRLLPAELRAVQPSPP